jgi:hypothetical protein
MRLIDLRKLIGLDPQASKAREGRSDLYDPRHVHPSVAGNH